MKILLSSLLLLNIAVCFGQEKISVNKTSKFNRKATITVISRDKNDPLDVSGKLENLLLNKEFDVVSEDVALEKSKRKTTSSPSGSSEESYKAVEINSIYAFKYKYRGTQLSPNWAWQKPKYIIVEMSGNIVDLANDGKLVATFTYSNSSTSYGKAKDIETVLEKIFDKLLN